MRRLTASISRRRNDGGDGASGQHTTDVKNGSDSAYRLHAVLGRGGMAYWLSVE
jgi:hypothetical protein